MTELDFLIEQLWDSIDSEDQVMSEYWSKLIDDHIGEEK
jgi:hypothetical protein